MPKYSSYIELSPHYESVVDLDAEERNPNLWQEYIVHEDMKNAVDKICQSVKEETKDARRSFWIHGAYGTGKSYAAIVLKHLFEDTPNNIERFLSKELLLPYRHKFVSIRERGEFLVVWKSGCTGIRNGVHLMMEMEVAIREKLRRKFGEKAYLGGASLVSSVKSMLDDKTINWDYLFRDQEYGLFEDYASFDELRSEIMGNDLKAADRVARIIMEKGWGLLGNVDRFQDWLKDVIAGNGLANTGIVFIWDEFTGFLRDCGDDNVLQRLSEYCKQQPFYMCLIVHRDPGWVENMGEQTYRRILHRYHELEFHISESAAYDLIGNSIWVRPGMEEQWRGVKKNLMHSIQEYIPDFDNLEMENKSDRLSQLCPLHPMTLSLLAIVAQNFGASQRTLFRFMKDASEADEHVGFIHYINNYGPDDWRWLTPDFLWDYFFTRESDMKDWSSDARKCYQHFLNKNDLAGNDAARHVFKAVLLLIAVMSTSKTTHLYSRMNNSRVSATKRCLYLCFSGQLMRADIDRYLEIFEANGLIRLDTTSGGDVRLELPYSGNADVFSIRYEQIQKKYTRYLLLGKKGDFAKTLEERLWPEDDATSRRILVCACSSDTNSMDCRKRELLDELSKDSSRIGILALVPKDAGEYQTLQGKLKTIAAEDSSQRLIVCILKEPLTEDLLNRWHQAITHKELASEEGKRASAEGYEGEAAKLLAQWVEPAVSSNILAFYKEMTFSLYGKDDLVRRMKENVLFALFPAAPERIVSTFTAFKPAKDGAALSGIVGETNSSQLLNVLRPLQSAGVFQASSIEKLADYEGNDVVAQAVAALASYMRDVLSRGTRIHLDRLWEDLQRTPFGYYNSQAVACILGSVMRFYKDSQYFWIDDTENTHILTEQNMATMILEICRGPKAGNTLSCGSKTWQKFKEYVQRIFALSEEDVISEEQARKFMREKLVTTGLPFWVTKYLDEETFGGGDAKSRACQIVDNIESFVNSMENTAENMENTISLFAGTGPLRKNITAAFADKRKLFEAFRTFVIEVSPPLGELMELMGVNSGELLARVKQMLQGAVYTWSEEEVESKLEELRWEYELIFVVNSATGASCGSVTSIRELLSNCFRSMKVPGSIVVTYGKDWIPALKALFDISRGNLPTSSEERKSFLETLKTYAKSAWQHISASRGLLEEYLGRKGISCSEQELDAVFSSLSPVSYDSPETLFSDAVGRQLGKIEFARNRERLQSLWMEASGTETITEWCKKWATPIQWVVPGNDLEHYRLLKMIQDSQSVDETRLKKTLSFFQNTNIAFLQDAAHVQESFLRNVGEKYGEIFSLNRDRLLIDIRNALGVDVYRWEHQAPEISKILENFLKKKLKEQYLQDARKEIASMNEKVLKSKLERLLEEFPELCQFFIDG